MENESEYEDVFDDSFIANRELTRVINSIRSEDPDVEILDSGEASLVNGPKYLRVEAKTEVLGPFSSKESLSEKKISNRDYYTKTGKSQLALINANLRWNRQKAREEGKKYYEVAIIRNEDTEPASKIKKFIFVNTEHLGIERGEVLKIVGYKNTHPKTTLEGAKVEVLEEKTFKYKGMSRTVYLVRTLLEPSRELWISGKYLKPNEEDIYRK